MEGLSIWALVCAPLLAAAWVHRWLRPTLQAADPRWQETDSMLYEIHQQILEAQA